MSDIGIFLVFLFIWGSWRSYKYLKEYNARFDRLCDFYSNKITQSVSEYKEEESELFFAENKRKMND